MSSRRRFPSAKAIASAASSEKPRSKKPKYLSLKLQLNQNPTLKELALESKHATQKKKKTKMGSPAEETHHQLNLFPLYPEAENPNVSGGEEDQQRRIREEIHQADDHVAILLETDAADTSTSLHGLLDSTTTTTTTSEEDPISPNYSIFPGAVQGFGEAAPFDKWLVRAAMRSRERDASEERWVSYCEVVEESQPKKKKKATKRKRFEQDEVNSGAGGDFLVPSGFVSADAADFDPLGVVLMEQQRESNGLSAVVGLKLDYQEILDAWSDKGSLYIDGGEPPPQTVPDLHVTSPPSSGSVECGGSVGNLWRVPDMGSMEMEENGGEKEWKLGQREASVLRYKEKRQNRLFSKRIRYEVRKLNAEKRPRLKGRFVKRIGE
ncbi:unnamed protein product [Linum tenue]|uniref:CCT domain-containing protein n=1 Tax=Linum tenue TaxID=586396 RepID=A0AAV0NDC6_9ROSI|nr:unnamed protein product [Linum tenue]